LAGRAAAAMTTAPGTLLGVPAPSGGSTTDRPSRPRLPKFPDRTRRPGRPWTRHQKLSGRDSLRPRSSSSATETPCNLKELKVIANGPELAGFLVFGEAEVLIERPPGGRTLLDTCVCRSRRVQPKRPPGRCPWLYRGPRRPLERTSWGITNSRGRRSACSLYRKRKTPPPGIGRRPKLPESTPASHSWCGAK
jgi:hypothetical protein